jgi:predicted transcriptional regulator
MPSRKPFTPKMQHAVKVLSERPHLSQREVSSIVGVTQQTVSTWMQNNRFIFRVKRNKERWEASLDEERLASKRKRIQIIDEKLQSIEARQVEAEEKFMALSDDEIGELKAATDIDAGRKLLDAEYARAKQMHQIEVRSVQQLTALLSQVREEMKGPEVLQPVYPEDDPEGALKVGTWMLAFADNLVDDDSPWEVSVARAEQVTLHEAARVLLEIGRKGVDLELPPA